MRVIKCDRCGEVIVDFPELAVKLPVVTFSYSTKCGPLVPGDLCHKCQKAVYCFIFGKEDLENYLGELADVKIMLCQLEIFLTDENRKRYTEMVGEKLDRQLKRIADEKEEYAKWRSGVNM